NLTPDEGSAEKAKSIFILREQNAAVFHTFAQLASMVARTIPARMSHSIKISTRATPESMTSPSRTVNFDRFIAPLQRRKATKEDSTVGRTVLIDGGGLEVEPDLRRQCTRCHVVRAAEGGKEVVQSVFVGDIDGRELQTHLVLVATEDVVVSDGNIEQASRRDTRRILVVVLRV